MSYLGRMAIPWERLPLRTFIISHLLLYLLLEYLGSPLGTFIIHVGRLLNDMTFDQDNERTESPLSNLQV